MLGPSFNAVIPPAALGKSYVYDPNLGHYVEGIGSAGPAPSNGIRFALYAIDPFTLRPATPLVEVGYADLLDESTSTTSRLHVLVKGTGRTPFTYADYTIVATSGTSSVSARAAGAPTGGARRSRARSPVTVPLQRPLQPFRRVGGLRHGIRRRDGCTPTEGATRCEGPW